ncbi:hypothetical protein ACJ73_08710 [Blastomyces percursus]|uniref:Initiation-specific alpha-1,6-mannosyltransferase n=1 Tax=Blastomyces percursus TaxID=1658174 RepID=A0A1J9PRL2_9EURO|nr:hypothetical protein ACJ73_08710 [Blastomyces percursus]
MFLIKQPPLFRIRVLTALIIGATCFVFYFQRAAIVIAVVSYWRVPDETASSFFIPKKIWYKLGPKGISPEIWNWTDSCVSRNPTFTREFLTDTSADEPYLSLPVPILKTDLLRYLLLLVEGGIWSDVDVSCEDTSIYEWIPEQFKQDAKLVVGLEFDVGWDSDFPRQFASWTVLARPGSRHLRVVVDAILNEIRATKEKYNLTNISELTLGMVGDVVDYTGPRRLTVGALKSLSEQLGEMVDNRNVSRLLSPKLIEDGLILPGYALALSANNYDGVTWQNGTDFVPGPPLVTHHYAGSWKNSYGGEVV